MKPMEPRHSYDRPQRYPFYDPTDFDWVLVAIGIVALLLGLLVTM